MSHLFNLKLDITMQEELVALSEQRRFTCFARFLGGILGQVHPVPEHHHFFEKSRGSRYELIHSDPGLDRVSAYTDLPEWLYRRLMLMHRDLDFYSMAQLMRWILRFFLELVDRYGAGFKQKLKRFLKSWQNQTKVFQITKQRMRQLFAIIRRDCQNISLINLYDAQFKPAFILKC